METDNTVNTSVDTSVDSDVDSIEASDDNYSLDDLLKLTHEDYEEFDEETNHKGMRPLHDVMKHMPEDARKHLANMRRSFTLKTQELSEQRRSLQAELEQERAKLQSERAVLYNGSLANKVNSLAEDQTEFDIYDPEGMKQEIQRQAANMLKEMLAPAQEQIAVEHRKLELNKFKTEHPEITTDAYRLRMASLLQSRPELKLEDAYYITKAQVSAEIEKTQKQNVLEERSARQNAFKKTSNGTTANVSGPPKFKGPDATWQAFQWHKDQAAKKKG